MKVNLAKLIAVMEAGPANAVGTGYLNRHTGEIVAVFPSEGEAVQWLGKSAAVDAVFNRGRIEAAPDDWIEVPKLDVEQGDDNGVAGRWIVEQLQSGRIAEAELE